MKGYQLIQQMSVVVLACSWQVKLTVGEVDLTLQILWNGFAVPESRSMHGPRPSFQIGSKEEGGRRPVRKTTAKVRNWIQMNELESAAQKRGQARY